MFGRFEYVEAVQANDSVGCSFHTLFRRQTFDLVRRIEGFGLVECQVCRDAVVRFAESVITTAKKVAVTAVTGY